LIWKSEGFEAEGSCSNCGSALVMNAEGEHECGCGTESYGADGSYAMSSKESFENNYVFPAIKHLEKLRNRLATMEGRNVMEGDYGPTDLDMNQRLSLTAANINEIIKEMKKQYLESNPVYDTEESDVVGFVGDGRQIGFLDAENDPDFDEEKADRNKDGKISDWERAVGNAVAKAIRENKEKKGAENFEAETRNRYGNRYITRDSKGRIKKNVSVGRSLRADRRRKAKRVPSKSGQGDKGDYNGEDMTLKDSAKLGFGVGAGLLGFNLTLLGIAAVGGFLLNRD
jgi:hypothetical protein